MCKYSRTVDFVSKNYKVKSFYYCPNSWQYFDSKGEIFGSFWQDSKTQN